MTRFDDALWERLSREHGADSVTLPARRRSRRPLAISAGAAGVAAAAAATVLIVSASAGAPPAYALTDNPDGTVTVSINDIETAIPALNAELQKDGIDVTVVPVEANCPSDLPLAEYSGATPATTVTVGPGHAHLDPGYNGVLAAEQLPDGSIGMFIGSVQGPVPSCVNLAVETEEPSSGSTPTVTATTPTTP